MAFQTASKGSFPLLGERLLACVAEHGSAAHSYTQSDELLRGPDAWRNLSDAVHLICTLHGRHPGVIDHAQGRTVDPAVASWFTEATDAFAAERSFLARLAVAAGPIPSTPGASDNQAAVLAQRHALEMLAQSERSGCALGAAFAVAVDWVWVRNVLDVAATRFGVEAPHYLLKDTNRTGEIADLPQAAASERALLFGAEQIATQHHALWDLLEARQQARAAA